MPKGCDWDKPSFTVNMNTDEAKFTKCDRCKANKEKCPACNDYSEFMDRGYVLIIKKGAR